MPMSGILTIWPTRRILHRILNPTPGRKGRKCLSGASTSVWKRTETAPLSRGFTPGGAKLDCLQQLHVSANRGTSAVLLSGNINLTVANQRRISVGKFRGTRSPASSASGHDGSIRKSKMTEIAGSRRDSQGSIGNVIFVMKSTSDSRPVVIASRLFSKQATRLKIRPPSRPKRFTSPRASTVPDP